MYLFILPFYWVRRLRTTAVTREVTLAGCPCCAWAVPGFTSTSSVSSVLKLVAGSYGGMLFGCTSWDDSASAAGAAEYLMGNL